MPDRAADEPAIRSQSRNRNVRFLPPELLDILVPSLKVGAGTGALGLFVGAASGIVRSAPVGLFALASGGQCFLLGSGYYASRRLVITTWGGDEQLTNSQKMQASAIAGGCAGVAGGLLRGPKNIIPGAIVFSLLGVGGQIAAHKMATRESKPKTSWLSSKWSPVTPLTDKEYENILEEKILKIDAEIAIVDERIAALRASKQGKLPSPDGPQTPLKDQK